MVGGFYNKFVEWKKLRVEMVELVLVRWIFFFEVELREGGRVRVFE